MGDIIIIAAVLAAAMIVALVLIARMRRKRRIAVMSSKSVPSPYKIAAWALLGMCVVYFGPAMAGITPLTVLFFIQLPVGLLMLFIDWRYGNKSAVPAAQEGQKPQVKDQEIICPKCNKEFGEDYGLDYCLRCGANLYQMLGVQKPPINVTKPEPIPSPSPVSPSLPTLKPLLNGRYEILTKNWKKGGMAIIHHAKDYQKNSECIIKEPRSDTTGHSPKLNVEKLKIEAEYLSKCHHPNIVGFIDQFTHKNGQFYLVEEYIEGNDLLAAFARTVAPENKVKTWAVQILDALDYIHRSGMIHRDFNPKNIMLTRDDSIVLIDFGTIKDTSTSDLTSTGVFLTRGFEAPELAKGFTDERTDIYGVGSILLYVLTSRRIGFMGNQNLVDFLLSKGISQRMAKCIDQALQMEPAFRFQTASIMRSALLGG